MKYIGAHVSVDGGVSNAPLRAAEMNMKAFALFTRNPSRWKAAPIPQKEANAFRDNCLRLGFTPEVILPHDSFLINLGAPAGSTGPVFSPERRPGAPNSPSGPK